MEEEGCPVIELLTQCVGTSITGIEEDEDGVMLRLNDGQAILIQVSMDGGFTITTQQNILH